MDGDGIVDVSSKYIKKVKYQETIVSQLSTFNFYLYLCNRLSQGEVLEWLKRHAWKACSRQNWLAGSNPVLSAGTENRFKAPRQNLGALLFLPLQDHLIRTFE